MAKGLDPGLSRTITWIAAVIAIFTAVSVPGIYYFTAYDYESSRIRAETEHVADSLSEVVFANPIMWSFMDDRLSGHLVEEERSQQRGYIIFDSEGVVILELGEAPGAPSVTVTAELSDGFRAVGTVQVVESVLHIWIRTGFVALGGVALGIAMFTALRVLPLRALGHAMHGLQEANAELRESEELFSRTFHVSPGLFAISRPEDGVHYNVNRTWMKTTGYSHEEAMAHSALELGIWVDPKHRAHFVARLEKEGSVRDFESKFRAKDGRVLDVLIAGEYIEIGDDPRLLIVAHDVTEHKRAEEQLRQAQKMEAVGQLTGGVAHDFNNLLTVILGNAQMLEERLGRENVELDQIIQATKRGAELNHRLLAFSLQQPLRPQAIDLGSLVSGMSEMLTRALGETIEIETVVAPDLENALADPGQVENALLNLALNARDAMPRGGKLTIECANVQIDDAYVADNPEAKIGVYVVLAVSDEGSGMTAEVQAHAFEPFFTTKEVGQGSGLGLSMIYGFAKQSGGHVNIYSEAGKGTTVKLYLPRAQETMHVESPNKVEEMPLGRGEVVLVIEDDPDVRALTVRMLEVLNYKVIDAFNAAAAHKVLAKERSVDLVLSDVVLPGGVSGPEFAEEARITHPELKIIYMSGYPAEAAKRNGFLGSGQVLLNKPFEKRELAKAIRDVLG